jgi:transposase-like protein
MCAERPKSLDAALPWLHLHGVSTGDMREALAALVGPEAKELSAPVVARLKRCWSPDYQAWRRRSLGRERWVYLWADGIYSGLRADDERLCALVVIGVNERGQKRFMAIEDGMRESKTSWADLLRELKKRGMVVPPKLAIGDGALGCWAALEEVFPATRQQRCWVHKTANVLNYLPKSAQAKAKAALHEIWMAETKNGADKAFDRFVTNYGAKYLKATECRRRIARRCSRSTIFLPSIGSTSAART